MMFQSSMSYPHQEHPFSYLLNGRCRRLLLLMWTAICWHGSAQAATDLATAPVNFLVSSQVKPNIYFILDDSGSMVWSYVGDEVVARGYEKTIGYRSALCNKIYYNPAVKYPVPVKPDGSVYPQQIFTAASYDGFSADSILVDLSSGFMAWRNSGTLPAVPTIPNTVKYREDCTGPLGNCTSSGTDFPNVPEAAYYYVYKGNDAAGLGSGSFSDACLDRAPSVNWTKVIVSNSSGPGGSDERTNFANWFSYHRTRILTIKTALGRAFRDLNEQFRVGFSTIGDTGVADTPGFLKIDDFTAEQKKKFYSKLYAMNPLSSTPLRAALSKAGRLYAGQLLTGSDDPVQYSCQQNFTVLSTDGYWNTSWESGSYGPKQIDGTTDVGDQDKSLPAPMADGESGAGQINAAQLVLTALPSTANKRGISSIKIRDKELLSRAFIVDITNNADADLAMLAWNIEYLLRNEGYRAVAQGKVVYVIAPDAADITGSPVVTTSGGVMVEVKPFQRMIASGRLSNTLADVAAYYFQTDLRRPSLSNCGSSVDLCANNVPVSDGMAGGSHQHMVTHTVGLAASGTLRYQENYLDAPFGDFRDIVNGKRGWPDPIFFTGPERIDDLWHAAVNGGGRYFNVSSPEQLANALSQTLANIRAAIGAAAAAATSNQEPAEGDSLLFATRYRSIYWDGELDARAIDLSNGSVSNTPLWTASKKLDAKVSAGTDRRTIWFQSMTNPDTLKRFVWSNLDTTEQSLFNAMCGTSPKLSQCANLSSTEATELTGEKLLNYLRGHVGFEDRLSNSARFFRRRDHLLGAVINAQPLYVSRPAFRYADDNYGEFRDKTQFNRKGTVYVAANDGMLHAFDAETGEENWAFIPAAVLPGMYRYADAKFGQQFAYLLDGTPVAGDVCPSTLVASVATGAAGAAVTRCTADQWRTILVGGLGAAGREFYALDITDPSAPKALWRFGVAQSDDVGYAIGRPLITKRHDGRWVVVLTSGYNNINPGSGQAYVFVLDAYTGKLLQKIGTGAGSTTHPAGLAQINGWVENLMDNTTIHLYGGDLLGNIWRFDVDSPYPADGGTAVRLAQLIRSGVKQPVTTRPELSEVRIGAQRSIVVTVGTGSYLGLGDAKDQAVQSIYSFRDDLGQTGYGDVRSQLVEQNLSPVSGDEAARTVSTNTVDWSSTSSKRGWFLDLIVNSKTTGERVTIDPDQQQGILRIVTNTPDATACRPSAESWIYEIDLATGTYIPSTTGRVIARRVAASALSAGARTLKLGEKIVTLITNERGKVSTVEGLAPLPSVNPVRRVSWRELDE